MARVGFVYRIVLLFCAASLLADCAWAIPVASPFASKDQSPTYQDASYVDAVQSDRSSHRGNALYGVTSGHTRSPLITNASDMPLRWRIAHRITTEEDDKIPTGPVPVMRCERGVCLQRIDSGRTTADMGANSEERPGDGEQILLFVPGHGASESYHPIRESLGTGRSDSPEPAGIPSYSSTFSGVKRNTWKAMNDTSRSEKAGQESVTPGSEAPLHASASMGADVIRDGDIQINPAHTPANLTAPNQSVLLHETGHRCAAAGVDHCIPREDFFTAPSPAQDSGPFFRAVAGMTSGREEADLSVIPTALGINETNQRLPPYPSAPLEDNTTEPPFVIVSPGIGFVPGAVDTGVTHLNDIEIVVVDQTGKDLGPNDLTHVNEGESTTFKVKLSSQPSSNVTVTLSGHEGTDLNPGTTSLVFTPGDYDDFQEINLHARTDADALHEDVVTLTFSGSGTAPDNIIETSTGVIIIDKDYTYVVVSPTTTENNPLEIPEGESKELTVSLQFPPAPQEGIGVDILPRLQFPSGSLTVLPEGRGVLEFSEGETQKTVTVTAVEDGNSLDETGSVLLLAYKGPNSNSDSFRYPHLVYVRTVDDEELELEINPTTITVIEGDQTGENFRVRLSERPSEDVTITIGLEPDTDLDLGGMTQLTFTQHDWDETQSVTVKAEEDEDTQAAVEEETITLTASGGGYNGVNGEVIVRIIDNDVSLEVTPTAIEVTEGGSTTFAISLSHGTSEEVTVMLSSSEGGESELDFQEQVTFRAESARLSVPVMVTAKQDDDDATGEVETISVTASGGSYDGMTGEVTVTIIDDDLSLEITPTAIEVTEGESGEFTVSLSHTPSSEVTVSIATEANSSLELDNTELTFTTANSPESVTVTALADDNSLDETETLNLTASGGGYDGDTGAVDVTIIDAQDPELVITPTNLDVPEGGDNTFTVALSEVPLGSVTVRVTTQASTDLNLDPQVLTFNTQDWSTPKPVTVSANQDEDALNDQETLTATANGGGYNGIQGTVNVTISDDESGGLIVAPTELEIPEGEEDVFTVRLSHAPASSVTVVIDRSGTNLTLAPSSTLTFTNVNWNTDQVVTVTAEQDEDAFDNEEMLTLTAIGATGEGYDGVTDSVKVTIIDDESLSLNINPEALSVNEGEDNTFTVALSERPLGSVTVSITTLLADSELSIDPTEVTFSTETWNDPETVTVSANHDEDNLTREREQLLLVANDGGFDDVAELVEVTILDDDLSLVVPTEITVVESTTEIVPVALSHIPLSPVTVNLVRIDPQDSLDSELILDEESVTFPAGNTSQTIAITGKQDADPFDEEDELLRFLAVGGDYDGISSDLLVSIEDSETLSLIINPETINLEEGDEEGKKFSVKLSHKPLLDVKVNISGHTNTSLTLDRNPPVLSFTVESWNDADTVTVKAEHDPDDVDDMVELMLTASGGGYSGVEGTVTVTVDDDESFLLRVSGESAEERTRSLTFTVTLDTPNPTQITRVRYETIDGTALASSDYVGQSGMLVFDPGQTTQTVSVAILDDPLNEPDESFTLVLSEPENAALAVDRATGTIVDDDEPPNVNLESTTQVNEGDGTASFVVTLNGADVSETVVVTFNTTQGTALAEQDYRVQTVSPLQFPPGTRRQSIDVLIVDDEIQEPNETFTITLTGVEHADLGISTSTVTIVDDDEASLSINDVRARESTGEAVFTVTLNSPSSTGIMVNYSTEDGTALAGQDYTSTQGTLSFSGNDANPTRTIRVPLIDNTEDEPDETFVVRLSGAVGAVIDDDEGIGTIVDDEPPISVSIYDGRASEDAGSLPIAARLNRANRQETVSVRFSSSDKTATAFSDYTATTGLLIFERGSTEGTILVEVIDDQITEGDETFEIMLSEPRNAVIGQALATGTIVENEGIPQLSIPNISVLESAGVAVFTMTLSKPSAVSVTVGYGTEDGSAEAGTDYVPKAGSLTFIPGEVQKEIRVTLLQDGRDWRAETFSLILGPALNAKLASTRVEVTIEEESTVEDGALNAYLSRMLRTSASHVVEAVVDRHQRVPECRLPNLSFLRYGYPNWRPSTGELLSGCGAQTTRGRWSVWGRGTFTRVHGEEGAFSIRSNVTTMALGTDYQWTNRLLTGLLASRSTGNGSYEVFDDSGEASSALTGIYPYLSYQLPAIRVWLLAGLGRGNAGVESLETSLRSDLVALGVMGTLVRKSGMRLSYTVDAFMASADPEQSDAVVVRRLRVGMTGSLSVHPWVRPYLETAIRHDAGDAETGLGLELGGGTRLAHPESWLRAKVDFRGLIMHASDGFQQWGASASIQYGNPQDLGPTAQIRPIWGRAGNRDFWRHDALTNITQASGEQSLDIELGYGARVSNEKSLVRPSLGTTLHSRGRDYRIGYNIRMKNGLLLSFMTTARKSIADRQPLSYGINANASLQW